MRNCCCLPADFTALGYNGSHNLSKELSKDILPQAIHYMTPSVVAILGQLAITASVMSSMDSSMLSASSLITRNVYHFILRPTVRMGVGHPMPPKSSWDPSFNVVT
ncbi:hypothetical protein MTO96_020110 [Rhipicephalus appendiculatus]